MRLRPRLLCRKFPALALVLLLPLRVAIAQSDPLLSERASNQSSTPSIFRVEVTQIKGGAELITILARVDGLQTLEDQKWVPLVSVLRDTLGDLNPENDRLRYVWPLSYTHPSWGQRLSSAIPFLYTRVGNQDHQSLKPPPPAMDLAAPGRDVWESIFWTALQNVLLDPYGTPVKPSTRSFRQNHSDYRKSQIVRALSVLSIYEGVQGITVFSASELSEIQARLLLTDKTFGGLVDDLNLPLYYERQVTQTRDTRGHNWELLRQRAEAESLYFEPLLMPDGTVTHALLWVAKPDLFAKHSQSFNKRFLNIADPWNDKRLLDWQGYSETRYFDAEDHVVSADSIGARPVEMIPLALYGLDNPKIPMVLVDFRDTLNPKKREMSRRLLQDVTRNLLSLSRFGDLPYFLGRTVFDFVTGRRGIDLNQPSRLRTYSQLKLLLALNNSLNPELRQLIGTRLVKVSLNPLENDLETETRIARQQYESLLAYANDPNGLPAKLDRDRRVELVKLEHGKAERFFFRLANVLSFGSYTHREKANSEMEARLDIARRLTYHTRFLLEVAKSTPTIEVKWDLEEVRRSLNFVAEHGTQADSQAISATVKIFGRTGDSETRRTCLESLSRITNPKARNELKRISQAEDLQQTWKDLIGFYLSDSDQRAEPFTDSGVKSSANKGGQH